MRMQLMLSPVLTWLRHAVSFSNAILSVITIVLLIYALGFPVKFDAVIPIALFKASFFLFFCEYTGNLIRYIKSHINRTNQRYKSSKSINPLYIILYSIVITLSVVWLVPTEWLERYSTVFTILRHNYLMIGIVAIESLLKLSAVITHSLSNRLSPSWIMVGSFLFMIIAGTALLLLPRATVSGISFFNALFTATSAVCVTGLTTLDVATTFTTEGHLIILLLIQLGGIGIMTFTSFFGLMFAGRHPSQNKMLIKDLIDPDNSVTQIFTTLRNIIIITLTIELIGAADPDKYPLQPKKHSLEFLREIAHLRFRTNTFSAIMRLRHCMVFGIHKFFNERGFYNIHTPLITASDCEGAGEMFQVTTLDLNNMPKTEEGKIDFSQDFFGKATNLTVSGPVSYTHLTLPTILLV